MGKSRLRRMRRGDDAPRRRFTYANVTATLALVVALGGGTAWAADTYLVTSTKQIKPSVLRDLRGARGKTGRKGAIGPAGVGGAIGATGATGPGVTIWQISVNADGSAQYATPGIYAVRNSAGSYTVSYSGFPGHAYIYCDGIGANPTETSQFDGLSAGSGQETLNFGGTDTVFYCEIVGIPGS
jgi:hypothetical protein